MRTSNKILLAAFALLAISLAIYDFELKTEYQRGDYKNPYRNFVTLNYTGFRSVELNCSTAANIMLVKGPFKVLANPDVMEFIKVEQHDGVLVINANFKYSFEGNGSPYILYISCPELLSVKTDARYTARMEMRTDTLASEDFKWRPTIIKGFTGDSLNIREDHASNIKLQDNRIGTLRVVAGISNGSASDLTIGPGNQFGKASLDIMNKSRLWIKEKNDHDLNYRLADSARLILDGTAQNKSIK
jgi:hypothetical protein